MGLEGFLGAGLGFQVIGLWQAFAVVKSFRSNDSGGRMPRQLVKAGKAHRTSELVIIAVLSVLHMIFSLIASNSDHLHGSGVGMAVSLERFGVATLFLLYSFVAFLSEGSSFLPLPAGALELIAIFAFGEEFLLFTQTRGGEDHDAVGLESQYYSLLLVPVGVCLLATALEIAFPTAVLPPLVRSMALILQGSWFYQMAVSLFTTKWMAQGCELIRRGVGDYTVRCEGMSSMRGRAIATLQFNCHLAMLLLFLLPLYTVMSKCYTVPSSYERLGDNEVSDEARGSLQHTDRGQELAQAQYFHVLEDEDEALEPVEAKDGTTAWASQMISFRCTHERVLGVPKWKYLKSVSRLLVSRNAIP
ncbi:hypothetical protein R1flu_006701 [Riccia fluitans]|uniref:Transmembrane protein n=1 Tax=Riccia fluitans TaxID=41844 RepID=A0ABD1YWR8_9MARC